MIFKFFNKKTKKEPITKILDEKLDTLKQDEINKPKIAVQNQKEFNKNFKSIKKEYSKKIYEIHNWMNSNLRDEFELTEKEIDPTHAIEITGNGYCYDITGPKTEEGLETYRKRWSIHFFPTDVPPNLVKDRFYSDEKICCYLSKDRKEYDLDRIYHYIGSDFDLMIEKLHKSIFETYEYELKKTN